MKENRIFWSMEEKKSFEDWFVNLRVGDKATVIIKNGFLASDKKVVPIRVLEVTAVTPAGNVKLSDGTIWNKRGESYKDNLGLLHPTHPRHIELHQRIKALQEFDTNLTIEEYNRLAEDILRT